MNSQFLTKIFFLLILMLAINHLSSGLLAEPEPEPLTQYSSRSAEPFLGEIAMFAGNFAPRGWAFCDGQLLSISQNSALFSLLGTIYGGDGRTTFALPDLRGRVPIHTGQGPGLSDYRQGQRGGAEFITLDAQQIPSHSHQATVAINAGGSIGLTNTATGNVLATQSRGEVFPTLYSSGTNVTTLRSDAATITVENTGGSLSHENRMPYLAVRYIIALQGVYPSRN